MPRALAMALSLAIVFLAQGTGEARAQAAPPARFGERPRVLRGIEAVHPDVRLAPPAPGVGTFRGPLGATDTPRAAGRVAIGGLLGGAAGGGVLGAAGALLAVSVFGCDGDCGPGGLILGMMAGEVAGLPVGAHLANDRRGRVALDLLESVLLGGGAAAAGASGGERSLRVLATAAPVLQLASVTATERRSLSGITVGAKGGWVRASMAGAPATGARSGAGFGGVVAFDFTPEVALQSELLYVRKGATAADSTGRSLSAAYFEVPLLLALTLPPRGSPVRAFVLAGPATAVDLTCVSEPPSPEGYGCQWDFDLAEQDFSLVGGAGVRVRLGGLDGTLELRYDHGLTRNRLGPPTLPVMREARNRAFMVFTGIAVPLGRARGLRRVP